MTEETTPQQPDSTSDDDMQNTRYGQLLASSYRIAAWTQWDAMNYLLEAMELVDALGRHIKTDEGKMALRMLRRHQEYFYHHLAMSTGNHATQKDLKTDRKDWRRVHERRQARFEKLREQWRESDTLKGLLTS